MRHRKAIIAGVVVAALVAAAAGSHRYHANLHAAELAAQAPTPPPAPRPIPFAPPMKEVGFVPTSGLVTPRQAAVASIMRQNAELHDLRMKLNEVTRNCQRQADADMQQYHGDLEAKHQERVARREHCRAVNAPAGWEGAENTEKESQARHIAAKVIDPTLPALETR